MQGTNYAIIVKDVRIMRIEERFRSQYEHGAGKEAVFSRHSLGWYIVLEGSREAMFIGDAKPDLLEGDRVTIRIEKQHAQFSSTPKQ